MQYDKLYTDIMFRLKEGLPPHLYYHGQHHTLDVMAALTQICKAEAVTGEELMLLKTAALLHDSGFLNQYKEHEQEGCRIARETLPQYDYLESQIETICGMIMATKIPQSPKNKLEEIICDADLDYLGRSDFYPIAHTLFKELQTIGAITDENEWNKLQVKFLSAHCYFTHTCQSGREAEKKKRIEEIKKIIVR